MYNHKGENFVIKRDISLEISHEAQEILDEIKKEKSIICISHISSSKRPCTDAIGSAKGLAWFIKENFPEKKVFIDGLKSTDGSHFLESLKTPNLIRDPTEEDYKNSLVIISDTAQARLIDSKHWKLSKKTIKIDDHGTVEKFADYEWLDTGYICASEMVGQMIMQSGLPHVSKEVANFILSGIVSDSNRFLYAKDWKNVQSSSRLFKIVSFFQEKGADLKWIYENLNKTSANFLRAVGYICDNFHLTQEGIAIIKITDDVLKSEKYNKCDFKGALGSLKGNYKAEEIKVWLFAEEDKKNNLIKISLRSETGIIINKVAESIGGGGHKFAAGGRLNSWEELENLINSINRTIKEQEKSH